jgi:RNA polymerase sigma factor (sigma-70 family)
MEKTRRLFNPFVDNELLGESLNELAFKYQEMPTTVILATSFEKTFKLAQLIQNQYYGLNEEDVVSWYLEKLDLCLKTYDGTAQFQTYFAKVFRNKLREETEKQNYKKRKCILESINDIMEIGLEDTYNVIDMLLPKDLTSKEHDYCILASQGYDNAYIAQQLDVSRMTISNIRKSLKVKCIDLQN